MKIMCKEILNVFQNQGKYIQYLYLGGGNYQSLVIFFSFFGIHLMSRHYFYSEKNKWKVMFQVSSELAVYDEKHKSQRTGKYIDSYLESELIPFITMSGKLHDAK